MWPYKIMEVFFWCNFTVYFIRVCNVNSLSRSTTGRKVLYHEYLCLYLVPDGVLEGSGEVNYEILPLPKQYLFFYTHTWQTRILGERSWKYSVVEQTWTHVLPSLSLTVSVLRVDCSIKCLWSAVCVFTFAVNILVCFDRYLRQWLISTSGFSFPHPSASVLPIALHTQWDTRLNSVDHRYYCAISL